MEAGNFYGNKTSRNGQHLKSFVSSSVPVDGNVSDVDNDSDDADLIDDNDDLVSVATPDAKPAPIDIIHSSLLPKRNINPHISNPALPTLNISGEQSFQVFPSLS